MAQVAATGKISMNIKQETKETTIQHAHRQEALAELSLHALSGEGLAVLMEEAAALVASNLQVEFAKVLELQVQDGTFLVRAGLGWQPGIVGSARVDASPDSQVGYTLTAGEPVVTENIRTEQRFAATELLHRHGVTSGLGVVINGPEGPYGVLSAHTAEHRIFSKDDINFVQAVANVLGLAVRNNQSESSYRMLMDGASDAIFVTDLRGFCIEANQQALVMLGYKRAELIGMNISSVTAADDLARRPLQYEDLMRGERLITERTLVRKDGSRVLIELSSQKIGHNRFMGIARDISDRKRSEGALRQSQELFSKAFQASPLVMLIARLRDRMIIDVNRCFEETLGYTREELADTEVPALNMIIQGMSQQQGEETILHQTSFENFEAQLRTKSGELVEAIISQVLIDVQGEPCILLFGQDVTDRNRLERDRERLLVEVQTERAHLLDVLTYIPTGVVMAEAPSGKFLIYNEQMQRLLRTSSVEAANTDAYAKFKGFHNSGTPYTPQEWPLARTITTGEVVKDEEINIVRGDGSEGVFSVSSAPLRDAGGDVVAGIVSFNDITHLKEIELSLRRVVSDLRHSEARFRALVEQISAVMYVTSLDEEGSTNYISPQLESMLGYSPEEWIAQPHLWLARVNVEDRERVLQTLLASREQGKPFKADYRMLTRSGKELWIRDEATIVYDIAEKPLFILGIMIDITDQKRLEEARRARLAAEQANQSKSEFLSRMSHELRTPLNSILGFAQLLDSAKLSDDHRKFVGYILQSGHHLLELINETLDISRIESGHLSIVFEPVRVSDVVFEAVAQLQAEIDRHNLSIKLDPEALGECFVLADHRKLLQVLLNILSNAVKFNSEGGAIRIECEAAKPREYSSDSPQMARISVTDTGRGIEEEQMEKLFTPFERLDADDAGIEGTGLGLALSQRLVKAMDGYIGITSKAGEGTTVWVELKKAETPASKLS